MARRTRAELRDNLKAGNLTLTQVFDLADTEEVVGRTRLLYILESLPKAGRVKARNTIEDTKIAESRRVAGVGSRQRTDLLDRLS
ncbi:integration host factor, actinobacterial type [Rhodococcus tibetensis]|uniref:integration host factor, actinobacterial type n=1 Tax=Rhodococcus tibetensis TaxID=2965064 RepID=UPI0027E2C636|nr:integration host factor, actinobacterial type [Rhodococcus sp. FXJ9.536]